MWVLVSLLLCKGSHRPPFLTDQEETEPCWQVCWVAEPAVDAVTNNWELRLAFKLSAVCRCSHALRVLCGEKKTGWDEPLLYSPGLKWDNQFPPMALNIFKSLLLQEAVPGITGQVFWCGSGAKAGVIRVNTSRTLGANLGTLRERLGLQCLFIPHTHEEKMR